MSIAETTVAAPPALVAAGGRLHLFWLDGAPAPARLRHAAVDPLSGTSTAPETVAERIDVRAGWPVAAASADRIAVAWMAAEGEAYRLQAAVWDAGGRRISGPTSLGLPAEQAGRVAMLDDADGWLIAWTQFNNPIRRVWVIRIDRSGRARAPAVTLAEGDGAALAPGPWLLWWQPVGFDTYRLVVSVPAPRSAVQPLTGTISLPAVIPPIPLTPRLSLVPVVERGFAATGRLYILRTGPGGASERTLLTERSVLDPAAGVRGAEALVVWSAVSGRRRNSDIFSVLLDTEAGPVTGESRTSLTIAGSVRPAVTAFGDHWAVAWLEVEGDERFRLVLATTVEGPPPVFLLGVPELDLGRPGRLLSFGAVVMASMLPYAAVFTAAFAFPAVILQVLAATIFGGFSFAAAIRNRPWSRFVLFLAAVAALEVPARALLPGSPSAGLLLLAMLPPGVIGAFSICWIESCAGQLGFWATVLAAVATQLLVVLFPWGASLLSQF